ncbi:hypothetical protein C8R45DRAFT_1008074 [Mycena sanguinolenta]|nr:hypothetical protein C8R45DRAFT_1008074 [Mycena sanguinolenta]
MLNALAGCQILCCSFGRFALFLRLFNRIAFVLPSIPQANSASLAVQNIFHVPTSVLRPSTWDTPWPVDNSVKIPSEPEYRLESSITHASPKYLWRENLTPLALQLASSACL